MSSLAKEELQLLELDLKEIYEDYGSINIYVLRDDVMEIDDVYNEPLSRTFKEYQVTGMIKCDVAKEEQLYLGRKLNPYTYEVKILKSSLDKHGITSLSPKDKLRYGDTILEIRSVKPYPLLGDYSIQYNVLAEGEKIDLTLFNG